MPSPARINDLFLDWEHYPAGLLHGRGHKDAVYFISLHIVSAPSLTAA